MLLELLQEITLMYLVKRLFMKVFSAGWDMIWMKESSICLNSWNMSGCLCCPKNIYSSMWIQSSYWGVSLNAWISFLKPSDFIWQVNQRAAFPWIHFLPRPEWPQDNLWVSPRYFFIFFILILFFSTKIFQIVNNYY